MSIMDKLEKIFFDLSYDEECNELVQLLSLDDDECEKRFREDQNLYKRYFPENIRTVQMQEPSTEEDSSSDEEKEPIRHQVRSGKSYTAESSYRSNRRAESEFTMPYHKGIPNPKTGSSSTIDTINIDDIFDFEKRQKIIDKWATELSLIIQSNKDDFYNAKAVILLLEHKSEGNIKEFIKKTAWNEELHGEDLFDSVIDALYTMFLGIDHINSKDIEKAKRIENARQILTKAQLCDICLLKDFTQVFEQNLFKLEASEYPTWIESYLMRIPIVGEKARKRWNSEKTTLTRYSLGFAIKLVKEEIDKYCDDSKIHKQLKRFSKKCCDNISESKQTIFGCNKNDKYSFQKRKYKKTWKKKKREFTPSKYFSKNKKNDKNEKDNFCPQGKKKCRCWICNEEGHYANECPSRKNYPEKVKLLKEATSEGFQPLEDPYEGRLHVYTMKTVPQDSSSSNSSESSDTE